MDDANRINDGNDVIWKHFFLSDRLKKMLLRDDAM